MTELDLELDPEMESEAQAIANYEDDLEDFMNNLDEERVKGNYIVLQDENEALREIYVNNEIKEIVRASNSREVYIKLFNILRNANTDDDLPF